MANITLEQLTTHNSVIPTGFDNPANFTQPVDGSAVTGHIWSYLLQLVSQPANGQPGYKNDDYNVLGGVVAACVAMDYDDYVYARLLSDPQFGSLRRYVTNSAKAAYYYSGLGPKFSAGNPFPDYRGFGACGGFYYTAAQITQWLYTLYSGGSVRRTTGSGTSGPLVSSAGRCFSGQPPISRLDRRTRSPAGPRIPITAARAWEMEHAAATWASR